MAEPHPGVAGSPVAFERSVAAAVMAVDGAAASHRSTARLHRLDGFERGSIVEVSVDRSPRWQLPEPVVTHHVRDVDELDLVRVDGIVTTSIARTLADLGSVVSQCSEPKTANAPPELSLGRGVRRFSRSDLNGQIGVIRRRRWRTPG